MSAEQPWWMPRLIDELKTLVASAAEGEGSQNEETEILLSMQAHHQRWLEEIVEAGMSRGILLAKGAALGRRERLDAALDIAAGVLIQLPLLEQDAWTGWSDPRLARVVAVLRLAELPVRAPRSALAPLWRRLRRVVPFELKLPRSDSRYREITFLLEQTNGYFQELRRTLAQWECSDPSPAGALGDRLIREVELHEARFVSHVAPLAESIYVNNFPFKRAAAGIAATRPDPQLPEAGQALRTRSRLRFHLAVWILSLGGLSKAASGLVLCHWQPDGWRFEMPDSDLDKQWKQEISKQVSNSLNYWSDPARGGESEPFRQLEVVEFEVRDLLRPVATGPLIAVPPMSAEDGSRRCD